MLLGRMTTRGRVTIPKVLRERTGMLPGSEVDVTLKDGEVVIRLKQASQHRARTPRRPTGNKKKRRG